MKKLIALAIMFLMITISSVAQENKVKRMPGVAELPQRENLALDENPFWISAEAIGGYSLRIGAHNLGMAEVDVSAGYRFNEFLKAGIGLGPRFYFDQQYLRYTNARWSMPLFLTARGNIISQQYRQATPWWGLEIGGAIKDGFMLRPTIGLKFGEFRHNFTIGVSYMGQNMKGYTNDFRLKNRFVSMICLRIGYEY